MKKLKLDELAKLCGGLNNEAAKKIKRCINTPKGRARVLTAGEIKLAQSVFGDAIDYKTVFIMNKKHNFLQGKTYYRSTKW